MLTFSCSSGGGDATGTDDSGGGDGIDADGGGGLDAGLDAHADGDAKAVPVGPPERLYFDPDFAGGFVVNAEGLYVLACPPGSKPGLTCGQGILQIPKDGSGGSTWVVPGYDSSVATPDIVFYGSYHANPKGLFWGEGPSHVGGPVAIYGQSAGTSKAYASGSSQFWELDRTDSVFYNSTSGAGPVDFQLSLTTFTGGSSVKMFSASQAGCAGRGIAGEAGIGYYLSVCPDVPVAGKTTNHIFALKTPLGSGTLPPSLSTWVEDSGLGAAGMLVHDGATTLLLGSATTSKLLHIDASGGAPKVLATFPGQAGLGVNDGVDAYVLLRGTTPNTDVLYRVPLDGSGLFVIAGTRPVIQTLGADDSYVYWAEGAATMYGGTGASVWRVGKGGGTPAK